MIDFSASPTSTQMACYQYSSPKKPPEVSRSEPASLGLALKNCARPTAKTRFCRVPIRQTDAKDCASGYFDVVLLALRRAPNPIAHIQSGYSDVILPILRHGLKAHCAHILYTYTYIDSTPEVCFEPAAGVSQGCSTRTSLSYRYNHKYSPHLIGGRPSPAPHRSPSFP